MKGRVNAGVACKEMVFDKGLEGDVLLEQDAFAAGIKRHSARPRITDTGEFERRCKGSVGRFPENLISQRQGAQILHCLQELLGIILMCFQPLKTTANSLKYL